MKQSIIFAALAILVLAGCQKPIGFSGEEVIDLTSNELLFCVATLEQPKAEQILFIQSEDDLRDEVNFNVNYSEGGGWSNTCLDNNALPEELDFATQTLLMLTYEYNDFGGKNDGDYTLHYFTNSDDNRSLLRIKVMEERGNDANDDTKTIQSIWVAIPKVDNSHTLELDKKIKKYR